MPETIKFKCDHCKQFIYIDRANECGAVFFKKKYYHQDCFCVLCNERAASKRSPFVWQEALDNILEYQKAAMPNIDYKFAKDDLNDWLLKHYGAQTIPKRFWTVIADLENGKYNEMKCKPTKTKLIFETWRWGQKHLDSINRKNKQKLKGPTNDEDRIYYDLAIVLKHVPDYLKAKAKREVEEAAVKRNAEVIYAEMNMQNMPKQQPLQTQEKEDMSDLFDYLYVE